ncbi:MAG TPA: 3-dehydroquinate synthase [Chthoniobacterales bacterium]|jgi:3-dehydroquinate synthase
MKLGGDLSRRVGLGSAVPPIIIRAGGERYEVFVGSGLLEKTGSLLSEKFRASRCALISDDNVAALFAQPVLDSLTSAGYRPSLIAIPPGEQSKVIARAEACCNQMAEAGLDRSSFVVALGGGVVGDLAGFVAAIYHRGIPYLQMPTTLLAQVDSSIGGKTAVNIAAGKNLIGAFHHPALVISDVDTLSALPEREWKQGFAEIIKHAIIRDTAMFEILQNFEQANLAELVRRNVEIKASIIAADDREVSGDRMLLNFGHTVGHAIERAGNYRDFLHGEAVSLGIVAACEISMRKAGLSEIEREKIVRTLKAFDLPTRLPAEFPREKVLEAIRFDKKFERGKVRFVVTPAIGSVQVATDVTMEEIAAAVGKL